MGTNLAVGTKPGNLGKERGVGLYIKANSKSMLGIPTSSFQGIPEIPSATALTLSSLSVSRVYFLAQRAARTPQQQAGTS